MLSINKWTGPSGRRQPFEIDAIVIARRLDVLWTGVVSGIPHQLENRGHQSLGLAQRQVKRQAQHQSHLDRQIQIARLTTSGEPGRRLLVGYCLVRHPQSQAAAPPKTGVVLRPVRHFEFHFRNMMAPLVVVFIGHGAQGFEKSTAPYRTSTVCAQQRPGAALFNDPQ